MVSLLDLVREISVGVEIYYTGRAEQVYAKSAFILCDDYTELTSKIFLAKKIPGWTDETAPGRYKNYETTLNEVCRWFQSHRPTEQGDIQRLLDAMKLRRKRRNDFFHSTHLLDLSIRSGACVEAFCDLLDYGKLLFSGEWDKAVDDVANLDTLATILQLEKCAASNPIFLSHCNRILTSYGEKIPKPGKGLPYSVVLGTDFYFRLSVLYGSGNLKAELKSLLPP